MKKFLLFTAAVFLTFIVNAQGLQDFTSFGIDGVYGEEVTDGNALVLKLVVPADASNPWDAQLITPSFRGLEGQHEGASFCLSFDYKGSTDDGVFSIFSGATYPYDPAYNQGGSTQIVDDLGTPIVWGGPNVSVSTDWQHYDYDYYLGAEGADSVRLQINCGEAGGDIFFKNFVLKIDGKVVHTWYSGKLVEKNNITYRLNNDGTATVVSSSASGAVIIESTIADGDRIYTVTSVGSKVFRNCSGLTSVNIPESVTSIGAYAFDDCNGLTSVTFAENSKLLSIGIWTFSNCSGLTSITIPESVTSIGYWAFNGIRHITYNGSATGSPWGAHSINGITDGDFVFSNAQKDTLIAYIGAGGNVTIPNSVTCIGSDPFYGCSNLTSVTIPNSVTSIGIHAFDKVENINYSGTATGAPWGALALNGKVFEYPIDDFIAFGDGVYDEEVTDGNALVLKLVVPAGTFEKWDAQLITPSFRGLEGQEEGASFCLSFDYKGSTDDGFFSIFSGATYPYDPAYNQGGSTQIVDDLGTPIVWGGPNVSVSTDWQHYDYDYYLGAEGADSVRLQINCGLAGASILFKNFVLKIDGKVVHTWYGDKLVKKNGITYSLNSDGTAEVVSSYTSGAASIESTIADGDQIYTVTSVASNAFSNCSDLTSVTIPNSVTSIGERAFYGVANINYNGTATFAEWDQNWGAYALNGTVDGYFIYADAEKTELLKYIGSEASVTIPNSVTSIGERAFRECNSLVSITIPNSVKSIGFDALYGCYNLISVNFANDSKLESIGSYAFYNCCSLGSITIPNSVTSIGNGAFEYCYGLTSVTFADGSKLESIGPYAFCNCNDLTSVTIPNSVTSIGGCAFQKCTGLTSVSIPESVTSIGGYAFYDCDNLTIYCEAKSKPEGWSSDWNCNNRPVVWNYKNGNGDESGTNIHHTDTLYIYTSSVDTLYIFNSDTIFSIIHDTLHSIAYDTIFAVSRDTVFVIAQTPKSYTLTATSANPQMGFAIGNGSYNENYVAEIAAISYYGYHFTKWSDGNVNNPRFESVTKNCNFVAEFEVNNYSVMADANNATMGNVEGAAEYAYLSRTQLKAVAKNGYRFAGWSDGETANPREVLVCSDTSFTAMFVSNIFKYGDLYYNIISQNEPYAVEVTYDHSVHSSKGIVTLEEPSALANNYSGLANVVIPSSVTYNGVEYAVVGIGDSAFFGCSTIKSVTIPNSVTSIGKDTFNGCSELTIQCEMPQKPESWVDDWNSGSLSIIWNVTDITADAIQSANIYAHHNVIVVENATDEISVFDAMGRCVAKRQADSDRTMIAMPRQGLYIVKVGTIVKKVFVE